MQRTVDCACVIHGETYDWIYVERLRAMLAAHIQRPLNFHVFTEPERAVPAPMIKHSLEPWPGIAGPRKSWWYKMQMFDSRNWNTDSVLYLDLDVIVVKDLDWIWDLDPNKFYAIRDFKYLWRNDWQGINSSMMFWNPGRWNWVWQDFIGRNINHTIKQFHGDQDYLNEVLKDADLQFFDQSAIKSWRWQLKDGGMEFKSRVYLKPDTGTIIDPNTKVIIFHGRPKPHEIEDSVLLRLWHQLPCG